MIGTRGVPARYGGFETAVEEIGSRLVTRGHQVTVYCRNPGQALREHKGMRLINLPALRRRSLETLTHTGLSVAHAVVREHPDVALVFNAANAPFLPILKAAGIPVAVHLDGLEWKRAKWGGLGAAYYRGAERWSVRLADAYIADARGIADHIRGEHGRECVYIPYGAEISHTDARRVAELCLNPSGYHLVVARMEPENHVREIVRGFVASEAVNPLVVVGSAPYSDLYTKSVHESAAGDARVKFVGGIWDQGLLTDLYSGALTYLHGHSVGGTNPSLLRAMGAGAPVIAHDNVFNREVTGGWARSFSSIEEVSEAIISDESDPAAAAERAEHGRCHVAANYRWDSVADDYQQLCLDLARRRSHKPVGQ